MVDDDGGDDDDTNTYIMPFSAIDGRSIFRKNGTVYLRVLLKKLIYYYTLLDIQHDDGEYANSEQRYSSSNPISLLFHPI